MSQTFKFRLVRSDGTVVEGGTESREQCLDHIYQCMSDPQQHITEAYYCGRNAVGEPYRIYRLQ